MKHHLAVGALSLVAALGFGAPSAQAQACSAPTVSFGTAPSGMLVGDVLNAAANVSATCQIQSVVASIPGASAPMAYTKHLARFTEYYTWDAALPASQVSYGPFTLTVTATDVFGNVGVGTLAYKKDAKPSISIVTPVASALARPAIRIKATCSDDDPAGCASVKVYTTVDYDGTRQVYASGTSSIDQDVSLAPYEGASVTLSFEAKDSAGQTTTASRPVSVDSNPQWVQDLHVAGAILDDSAKYTLYAADASRLWLLDKSTGSATFAFSGVYSGKTYSVSKGFVTPRGALFVGVSASSTRGEVFESIDGAVSALGFTDICEVEGGYATLTDTGVIPARTSRLNVAARSFDAMPSCGDLTPNGDVVYANDGEVFRDHAGVRTVLTSTPSDLGFARGDDLNAAYVDGLVNQYGSGTLRHISSTGVDSPLGGVGSWPWNRFYVPFPEFALRGGWTAYQVSMNGSRNVWVRSPTGADTQLTFFNDAVSITALNDDGRVIVKRAQRLSIVQPGTAAREIGNPWKTFWRDGNVFQIVGDTVLRLTGCTFAVAAATTGITVPPAGGSGTTSVTATNGCAWNATANDPFDEIRSGATGSGNGTVTYAIAANTTSASRTGSFTIAGRRIDFVQGPAKFPAVTWGNPASIVSGTTLSSKQLNAAADVPGTFDYAPAAGTVLPIGTAQTLSVTFTPTDNANYAVVTKTVKIDVVADATAPTGTVRVNSGAAFTSSPAVTLTLSATDADGAVSQMAFSNDGATWSAYEPYETSRAWTLTSGDGTKTVSARFKDGSGNVSTVATASIGLDTIAPTGTLILNGGALVTTSVTVTDSMSATDTGSGVTDMSFSADGIHWGGWESYGSSESTMFEPGAGVKTLFARFRDAAGNVSASASDTIFFDPSAATDYGVNIDNGVRFTTSRDVRLAVGARSSTSAMQISNDPSFAGADWEPFASGRKWTLPGSASGVTATVYAHFRDTAGRVSATVQDDIGFDDTPPVGTVRAVNHPSGVVLELNATDDSSGVEAMTISNEPTFGASVWEPYATTKNWSLAPSGVVYVRFKDAAGNISAVLTPSGSTAIAPFGRIDTPVTGSTGLQGSFAVTGWALDDAGIDHVELWRDLATGETTPPYNAPGQPGHGKIFIANALVVDGARPDVEAQYPTLPRKSQAGWGYLLLSQGLWNQGNGTYTLYAYGYDKQGANSLLGTTTITVDNAHASKPFGAIDTPGVGETVAGAFYNFGWALTPKSTPTCTIGNGRVQMSLDSRPLVTVNYGDLRPDIAGAFPGFSNAGGAGGSTLIDTTTLEDGVHQIGWLVYDNCGRGDGVGSRFFTISNGSAMRAAFTAEPSAMFTPQAAAADPSHETDRAADRGSIRLRRPESDWAWVPSDADGSHQVTVDSTSRIELELPAAPAARYEAYQIVNGERRNLPLGSSFDASTGTFFWQPAPAFRGAFDLVFETKDAGPVRVRVRVN
jgi:hypothetical protein